ncbi:hypothetical protein ACFSLT_12470 [Novosphingobium resinovorum]
MAAVISGTAHIDHPAPAAWTTGGLFTVGFLGVTAGIQMSDRGLQAIVLSAIQHSFAVSDATIGALQGLAGVLVGSAVAVPVARLADRFSRKLVLLGLIVAWTTLMVVSAVAPDFPCFSWGAPLRGYRVRDDPDCLFADTGSCAGAVPRCRQPDFAALMAAGASAGFYFGSAIVSIGEALIPGDMEAWRKAMLLLSSAGLPLLLLGLLATDPPRHIAVANVQAQGSLPAFLRERWQAVGLFVGVVSSLMIAVQALNPLIALALERRFNAGMGPIGHALG